MVFIDEIDAIGQSRSGQSGGLLNPGAGLLNELLIQMDSPHMDHGYVHKVLRLLGRKGSNDQPVVLTIGATNLPGTLDPALVRPGRFDRSISVDAPDFDGRKDILQYYINKVVHKRMDLEQLVSDPVGYTPVMIKHVVNEAVVLTHFDGSKGHVEYGI